MYMADGGTVCGTTRASDAQIKFSPDLIKLFVNLTP
jgi:hypothetical protein